jgi:adenylate cyclase, class 2
MQSVETEVKFYLFDIKSLHERILKLGAESQGRFFERNLRFDDARQSLKQKRSLLRLRQDKTSILTLKSTPADDQGKFKIMTELEVEVSDFDTMHHILEALGFHPEQIYEKWRETFEWNQTKLCLDSMPFGDFIEIEGPEAKIEAAAGRLELDWHKRILLNYLDIFDILKNTYRLGFSDVTFENFKGIEVHLATILNLIEAGRGK